MKQNYMKEQTYMKKINVTFSIPPETHKLLQSLIERRKMSMFVEQAIYHALQKKLERLKLAYTEAEKDPDRTKTIQEWSSLDTEEWE